jgi:hypothetical protein
VTATSIGFIPKKWEFLDRESGGGVRFIETECLEYSFVSVPANSEALIIAKAWRGTAPIAPAPSTLDYCGTLQQRQAFLRWQHPDGELDAAIAAADRTTVEGRRAIVAAHRRFGERTMR